MKIIAITTDGSNIVSLVKSVDEQEEKKLVVEQEKSLAKREELAKKHEERHANTEKALEHFGKEDIVLAKSVYDNFVALGLIESNDEFQQGYYDFFFNGAEFPHEKAPDEFVKILKRVGEL